MSDVTVNNPQSRRIVTVDPAELSRYGAELAGYAKAGGRVESRLELTHRNILDVQRYIRAGNFQWYGTEEFDRLDIIAFEYLGDSRLWWVIADFNYDIISDTLRPPLNVKIRIPKLEAIQELFA